MRKKEMDKNLFKCIARSLVCKVDVLIFHWWRKKWMDENLFKWNCVFIRSNNGSPLSSSLCFFGPSAQALQPSAGTQRHGHYHIQNSSSHKHHKYSQWKKMPFLFSLTICGSTLPGFSFWRESSFPFWGVFFLIICSAPSGYRYCNAPRNQPK